MRLYTLASARTAPANSRTKGSVYKTRLSHAPCHVYFCLSVVFVYPPLETVLFIWSQLSYFYGVTGLELLWCFLSRLDELG